MKSLGDLVDRLTITNIKLWHVQDVIHKAAADRTGVGPDTVQKSVALNLERNRLMTEIDECMQEGSRVDPRVKIT